MELIDIQLSSLLFIIPLIHLIVSPHTKVEESFNLQASHDILVYGTPTSNIHQRIATAYDHWTFPGAVPRTFMGSVILAGISQPLVFLSGFHNAQFVVRGVLGAFNAGCLLVFRNALATAFGKGVARWWTVFLVTQFHVIYYLSRTLPNMFAFGLTTLTFAFLLPKTTEAESLRRRKQSIVLLTLSAAVFRAEIAILLGAVGFFLLSTRQLGIKPMIAVFLIAFTGALGVSIPIDSYFWRQWIWPEFFAFYFNAIQGSSSDWGVSPWHFYFTSALPRLLINPFAILLIGIALYQPGTTRQAQQLTLPSLIFILIYSFQPHKEARFIFYVVPPMTAAAALGANFLSSRMDRSFVCRLATYSVAASVPCSLALSSAALLVSALNYPGGDALLQLQHHVSTSLPKLNPDQVTALAHADVLTCMTGLTLFGQNPLGLPLAFASAAADTVVIEENAPPMLLVDKTEKDIVLGKPSFWEAFDYALEENPALPLGDNWEVLGVVHGFDGIDFLSPENYAENDELKEEPVGEKNILGLGAVVADIRQMVRGITGGWWIGPRMSPRIRVMKKFERV